ncbi:hypothetical protein QBC46DRAFT_384245 [Diplogelasinospora grovesii]|uniref:Uncharacterized protein n=1 Tax=Diplogelasinospora grovesii TaxID=303347 RepID=A0AAN6N9B4_9PEZI|nr:hypothetical protein QBC46DRAFT_384245 [Diplogelasinospora grovesii]
MAGFIYAENKVPQYQRMYQQAYRAHTRLWKISPRSTFMLTPFTILMWGTFGGCMWMMGRKVMGKNTWFGN